MGFTKGLWSGDKIAAMPKQSLKIAVVAVLLVVFLIGAYQFPPVQSRLGWRVDFALARLRGMIDPIETMPTALPQAAPVMTAVPTVAPTLVPSPTLPPTEEATATPLPSQTPLPRMISLPAPKWEKQDINNCGPAALAMYLRFYGWEGDQTDITEIIKPFREDRNVNVEELAYYVRNYAGWLNIVYRVGGDLEMIRKLLAAGIPVMIEESFMFDEDFWPNDDRWAAHYQLVTGYDEDQGLFTGQDSYYGADQQIPAEKVDASWQAFNRLYILIYLPQQEETVKAILGENWDPDANRRRALEIARTETESDPENAYTWFNLGANLTYFEEYMEATDAFDKAREIGLPQRMLRYQFSPFIAYFHTGQIDDLIVLTEYALKVTPNSEEALLWHGWAMYRKGDHGQAVIDFQQALVENPNYQDATYALNFVGANP